jgi:hypothetical protein
MARANGAAAAAAAVDAQVGQAVELARQSKVLHSILAELRSDITELAVHDGAHQELILEQFPVAGSKRVVARRTGGGFDSLPVPTAPGVLVLAGNTARLGCQLVNSGTSPVILYLSDMLRPGVPAIWLGPSGGSWDGRFGNMVWCGNVFAVAQGAATVLVGGEL